jgi:hypothetical protein
MTIELLKSLMNEHAAGSGERTRLDNYYRHGYYDTLDIPKNARAEYRNLIEAAVTNWCALVVETTAERLIVDGFRSPGADSTDAELWQWWQANGLDSKQMQLNTSASVLGSAVVSVWPASADEDRDAPHIVPESSAAVHLSYSDTDIDKLEYALKVRGDLAWIYTDTTVERYRMTNGANPTLDKSFENPLGAVPFVRFAVNLDLDGNHSSDLNVAIPVQNRITETTVDRSLASRLSGFRQRYATGIEVAVDAVTGEAIAPYNAAADRLWTHEDPDVKFGEFSEATLSNYIGAVAADVHHLAAITRTPPHYLLGQMTNLSAEALAAAETGLARKVQERQQTFGESWEDVARLAQKAAGRETVDDLEVVWRRTETVSDAQVTDAALKQMALGVPQEALWQQLGATPTQITEWRRMSRGDALRTALATPLRTDAGSVDPANIPATDPETEDA